MCTVRVVVSELPAAGCGFGSGGHSPLPPLAQLSILVHAEVLAVADGYGLTPKQGRMLGLLRRGPRRMNELAQALGVERAAVTGLVDRAEARGLVAREAVPGDRRSTHVVVTEAGAGACEEFHAQLTAALDALLDGLPAEDRAVFTRCVERIVGARVGTLATSG